MKKSIITSALCMALSAFLLPGTASAAGGNKTAGDLNGDGLVNISDILSMRNYLLKKPNFNFTREQYEAADINGDNSVDSLDLVALRKIIISNAGRMPVGTWVILGTCEDYFYFDGNGNVTVTNTYNTPATNVPAGTVTENKVSISGDKLIITGASGTTEYTITWVNKDLFNLTTSTGVKKEVVYCGGKQPDYNELLNGTWLSDSGRDYGITGFNGYYAESGSDLYNNFYYEKDNNNLTFHFGNSQSATVSTAVIIPVDSMHIDLKWSDGTVERLTKRNFEVIDGITYINGILIANKSYDLPSSYNPGGILPEAQAAFNEMQAAAQKDGLWLEICSGFRSYSYQATLYNNYVARDGKAAADTYSARPGHSEHQTGLAMDINMAGSAFDNTPEAKWIAAHCADYGFIIRYPQGKQDITGYKYESWHVRYLGKELAKEVTDSGLTLEEFLCISSEYTY